MFDLRQVNAYRSVEAPEELRQQVLQAAKEHRKPKHRSASAGIAALAACLALVLSVHFAGQSSADVILMGEPLREGSAVVVEELSMPAAGPTAYSRQAAAARQLELELKLDDSTRLKVSDGAVTVLQQGEVVENLAALRGTVTVLWEIDPTQVTETYQLEMYGGESCCKITLSYEENQGGWIAQINH